MKDLRKIIKIIMASQNYDINEDNYFTGIKFDLSFKDLDQTPYIDNSGCVIHLFPVNSGVKWYKFVTYMVHEYVHSWQHRNYCRKSLTIEEYYNTWWEKQAYKIDKFIMAYLKGKSGYWNILEVMPTTIQKLKIGKLLYELKFAYKFKRLEEWYINDVKRLIPVEI